VVAAQERTNYPLMISVDDLGEGFTLVAQANCRVDPRRIVGYMTTALQSLVQALEQASQLPVMALPILPESERQELLESFSGPQAPYPRERLIHQLFEQQVSRTPRAVAAMHEGRSVTYAELNARANQLARYLQEQGVGPNRLVALCLERSINMLVGLLAALKAGAAYVPVDPNYPPERVAYMLEDAAPQVVLTQEKLRPLVAGTRTDVIALDALPQAVLAYSDDDLPVLPQPESAKPAVYVIYTSGSTGKPKGTTMGHQSMVNLVEWHRAVFPDSEGARVVQFAALSFDVAFQEIFSTLCTGGTLVLLDEWIRRDARALIELISSQDVQRLFVPPLMLQSLAECSNATGITPTALRDVITAGEQLRVSPEIAACFKRLAGCRLHNHYGPTESHVVTALTLTGNPEEWPALPTIGRPISNTQIYVLDSDRRIVPLGVSGEIYIGGANVALGYRGRPELTAERFVSDPFSADPDARLYKTGDLGRWRPDGTLEYLGRNDYQVKIRGYRIELGEVESQLARHEQVREAAVIAREDVPGEKRLVAYVTQQAEGALSVEELRAYLKGVLPEYMVPSAFVLLEKLPLTPNGKLDRRALPAPEAGAYAGRQFEAPQGEVEQILAGIWQALLGVEQVGRHDNFFELGGHSLHTMQLTAKVSGWFGVNLPVIAVFQAPTIQHMAEVVESLPGIRQVKSSGELEEFEEGAL
jgi:amino acid adenylation domain-containing protein